MTSCLYTGWVRHRRHHPRVHDFRYRLVLAYLDLDALDPVDRTVRTFSVNRWNLWSFFDRDHMDGRPGATAVKVRRLLARHGIARRGGSIRLLTQCRVLGYVFNPVSLYYCHDADGRLAAVVAEVSNTFGERHLYLLDGRNNASTGATARFRAPRHRLARRAADRARGLPPRSGAADRAPDPGAASRAPTGRWSICWSRAT